VYWGKKFPLLRTSERPGRSLKVRGGKSECVGGASEVNERCQKAAIRQKPREGSTDDQGGNISKKGLCGGVGNRRDQRGGEPYYTRSGEEVNEGGG